MEKGRGSRPLVGISACLVGQNVRYDGKNKLDSRLLDTLRSHVDLLPVCPEAECGMGVPRPPIQLFYTDSGIRAMTLDGKIDFTDRINQWAARRIGDPLFETICGFVLKARSPSCGPEGLEVFKNGKTVARNGVGLFAAQLFGAFPGLPVETEDALRQKDAVEGFIKRVRMRFKQKERLFSV